MARGVPSEVLDHFRSIPMFSSLSKGALRAVVRAADELDVRAGTTLVREGESDRALYVLVDGAASVSRRGRTVGGLEPGDFFGELSFLDRGPRSATVTASSGCRLLALDARRMDELVHEEPKIAHAMLAALAAHLRETERSLSH